MLEIGRLQKIINAKKLLEDEGYQSPRLKPTQGQLDTENSRLMELVDSLATHITEMNFGLDTYGGSSEVGQETVMMFTEEAQDYYNEMYDEYETLINNYLNN